EIDAFSIRNGNRPWFGRPTMRCKATWITPPWVTTKTSPCSWRARIASISATTLLSKAVARSPPGTTSQLGSSVHRAHASGNRSASSWVFRPSHSPRKISLKPAAALGEPPVTAPIAEAVSKARLRAREPPRDARRPPQRRARDRSRKRPEGGGDGAGHHPPSPGGALPLKAVG